MSVSDSIALIFNQALHFEGRKQVPRAALIGGGLRPSDIALAVQFGWIKEGVHGYWLPEPCDPGFLSVVDSMQHEKDVDCTPLDIAIPSVTIHCIDLDHASRGALTGRYGKDLFGRD